MRDKINKLLLIILILGPGLALGQSVELKPGQNSQPTPSETQKLKSQADDFEDKSAQAIDEGNMGRGLAFMARAVALDPTPMRHMIYGSMLFGDGVAVFKESDKEKGKEILRRAEAQLRKALAAFDAHNDQFYISRCYYQLGEIYLNAFGDKEKAREYYRKSAGPQDRPAN